MSGSRQDKGLTTNPCADDNLRPLSKDKLSVDTAYKQRTASKTVRHDTADMPGKALDEERYASMLTAKGTVVTYDGDSKLFQSSHSRLPSGPFEAGRGRKPRGGCFGALRTTGRSMTTPAGRSPPLAPSPGTAKTSCGHSEPSPPADSSSRAHRKVPGVRGRT